jgi:anti-anti-sigma factor
MAGRDEALGDPLKVQGQEENGTVWLSLSGAFGQECRPTLKAELKRLASGPLSRLVLDLRRVTFVDSAALQMILEVDARCRRDGAEFILVRGSGQVERVLELTGLTDKLNVVDEPPPRVKEEGRR